MRVTVVASGSRGDVQPMAALARGLAAAGYQVALAAPGNFEPMARGLGIAFHGFSVDVEELLRSDLGRSWLGHSSHSPMRELRLLTALVEQYAAPMAAQTLELAGTADLFISGIMTVGAVSALSRRDGSGHVCALLAPFHPTAEAASGLYARRPGTSRANRWIGESVLWGTARAFGSPGFQLRGLIDEPARYRRDYREALRETPTLLGVSPLVVPPAADWPDWVEVTGYWALPEPADFVPDTELAAFLAAGEPPVYLGFGSMSTHDPVGTWRTLLAGLAGRRAVIHSGGADLAEAAATAGVDERVLVVGDVPHEWLFPRMAAVVHHGGAGTTAAGLRSGVPSAAVPHIGDQPYWGRRIAELTGGPAPVPRHLLSPNSLAALLAGLDRPSVRARAAALGERLRAENGVQRAVAALRDFGFAAESGAS